MTDLTRLAAHLCQTCYEECLLLDRVGGIREQMRAERATRKAAAFAKRNGAAS